MGNARVGEFRRWVVQEMGSLREGVYEMESLRDVELSRCEIHEIGS